jgi:hypothetical protein
MDPSDRIAVLLASLGLSEYLVAFEEQELLSVSLLRDIGRKVSPVPFQKPLPLCLPALLVTRRLRRSRRHCVGC